MDIVQQGNHETRISPFIREIAGRPDAESPYTVQIPDRNYGFDPSYYGTPDLNRNVRVFNRMGHLCRKSKLDKYIEDIFLNFLRNNNGENPLKDPITLPYQYPLVNYGNHIGYAPIHRRHLVPVPVSDYFTNSDSFGKVNLLNSVAQCESLAKTTLQFMHTNLPANSPDYSIFQSIMTKVNERYQSI